MSTLDVLSERINSLKDTLRQLKESNLSLKNKIEAQIVIIEECEKVIGSEKLMLDYDFSSAIQLVESHNYNIDNLSQIISDIQSVLFVREELNMDGDDIPFEENQISTFTAFIEKLETIKSELEEQLAQFSENFKDQEKIRDLESLKHILEGTGRRKYYTLDMFRVFYDEFNILSLPPEEAQKLLEGFYQTRNLSTRQSIEKANIEDVIGLFRDFISPKKMRYFELLLNDHKNEVISVIDLDNAREIMHFFQENGILEKFRNTTLLKITLYGKAEYIKEVVYPKVVSNTPDAIEAFYEDDLASIWIKEKDTTIHRASSFRKSRGEGEESGVKNLSLSCYTVDYDEFWENVELLKENRDLFGDQVDIDEIGAYLGIKTLPVWVLRKNIELCKLFELGMIAPVPPSCIDRGDIEDKIHLAIELGLLHSPLTSEFHEMDKNIVRNDEFQINTAKKGIYNQSIRNYYQRYLGRLSVRSINEYAYMFYKLQSGGYEAFYNEFFSNSKAGQADSEFFTSKEKKDITNKEKMSEFISDNFMSEWYSDYIPSFDEYDDSITKYSNLEKGTEYGNQNYYDNSILDDPFIKELEKNNTVMDILIQNGEVIERKNEFVYMFGNRIISRYKVLHNASILKKIYGSLSKEMLMAAIVRNTFLDIDTFQEIYSTVMERGRLL